jgi:conjugal transfer pilus assembly protein TraD
VKHRREEPMDPWLIGDHLSALCIPFITGLALGLVFLLALRFERLRWTWTLLGAPLAYLLWLIDWQVGLCLTTAITTAAGGGLYWQMEDTKRGGEEARAAREALGPLHAARAWAAQRKLSERRVRPARKPVLRRAQGDRLALGQTRKGGVCEVPLGVSRGVHSFVIGATGAGKTVTQAAIAQAHVLAGQAVIVIDPKGDRYLCRVLQEAARHMGVRFRGWSPTARAVYNPFARGGPTEITDKALAGHRWTEPHYELATQRLLLHVLTTMQAAGQWPPTLSGIVRHMDPDRLDLLAQGVGGDLAARVSEYVDGLSARGRSDLGGGRDRLAVLADGELGPRLDPERGDGPQIDLAEALRQRGVVYFQIDADRFPAASKLLGAALVIDLVTLTADMQDTELSGLLVIDEFAALAAEQVSRLFGRARSAGLSVLLGTQSLADLRGARPDDDSDTLTEQVLTNIEFAVVHREADPDSAERLARLAGTRPAWTTTEKIGGRRDPLVPREGTRTRTREFVVLPDEIKRLGVGEAVLVNPTAKTPGEILRILAPTELRGRG